MISQVISVKVLILNLVFNNDSVSIKNLSHISSILFFFKKLSIKLLSYH